MERGTEWIVDAAGCDPAALASSAAVEQLLQGLVDGLRLKPVSLPVMHQFPDPGGITGMILLSESHLTIHTFPEHGTLCLNLFSCRPRPEWDFTAELKHRFGASGVEIRSLERATV